MVTFNPIIYNTMKHLKKISRDKMKTLTGAAKASVTCSNGCVTIPDYDGPCAANERKVTCYGSAQTITKTCMSGLDPDTGN